MDFHFICFDETILLDIFSVMCTSCLIKTFSFTVNKCQADNVQIKKNITYFQKCFRDDGFDCESFVLSFSRSDRSVVWSSASTANALSCKAQLINKLSRKIIHRIESEWIYLSKINQFTLITVQ